MSQGDQKSAYDALLPFVISALNIDDAFFFASVVAIVIVYYEFAITFSDEVRFIWSRRLTLATVLFCINRYTMLLAQMIMIVRLLPYQKEVLITLESGDALCSGLIRSGEVLTILSQISAAVFVALRMFAIWNQDYRIFTLVFVLGTIGPVSSIYFYTVLSPTIVPLPLIGCAKLLNVSAITLQTCNLAVRLSAILSEIMVLILTWMKTIGTIRISAKLESRPSVVKLVFRDGTLYFLSLLIVNILCIFALRYQPQLFGGDSDSLSVFSNIIMSVAVSRFLLNLREACHAPLDEQLLSKSLVAPNKSWFAKIPVGNIGAPLYSILEPALDDDNWEGTQEVDEELDPTRRSCIGAFPNAPTSPTTADEMVVIYDGDENGVCFVVDLKDI